MDRSRLNLAALVLALSACWGVYVGVTPAVTMPVDPAVVPGVAVAPAAGAAGSRTGGCPPGTTPASATGPAGRAGRAKTSGRAAGSKAGAGKAKPGARACTPSTPLAAAAPVAEDPNLIPMWFVGGTTAVLLLLAGFVRIVGTRRWVAPALAGVIVAQVGAFALRFVYRLLQPDSLSVWATPQVTPALQGGAGLILMVWCLQVFAESERQRVFVPRTFEGPSLVEEVKAIEEAKAKELMEGGDHGPMEMPSFVQVLDDDQGDNGAGDDVGTNVAAGVADSFAIAPEAAAGALLATGGPLGTDLIGGWIECGAQAIIRLRVDPCPGAGIEMLIASEQGEWASVPSFDPASGIAALSMQAGRWYVAVRDNAGRNMPVTFTARAADASAQQAA